jgi:hypothetical protein
MTREEAEAFVREALALAMTRDASSGGVIRMITMTQDGAAFKCVCARARAARGRSTRCARRCCWRCACLGRWPRSPHIPAPPLPPPPPHTHTRRTAPHPALNRFFGGADVPLFDEEAHLHPPTAAGMVVG